MDQFLNGLRVLYSLDAHELGDPEWWGAFASDPFRYAMRCDSERAGIIWRAMVKRGVRGLEI
jgi:hypothetical protein